MLRFCFIGFANLQNEHDVHLCQNEVASLLESVVMQFVGIKVLSLHVLHFLEAFITDSIILDNIKSIAEKYFLRTMVLQNASSEKNVSLNKLLNDTLKLM